MIKIYSCCRTAVHVLETNSKNYKNWYVLLGWIKLEEKWLHDMMSVIPFVQQPLFALGWSGGYNEVRGYVDVVVAKRHTATSQKTATFVVTTIRISVSYILSCIFISFFPLCFLLQQFSKHG